MNQQHQLKEKGNALFASGDNAGASSCYTEALSKCDPEDRSTRRILHSNRSAARLKAGDAQGALRDADDCLSLGPGWSRGLMRRGMALLALERFPDSVKAFESALMGDPDNTSLKEHLEKAKSAVTGDESVLAQLRLEREEKELASSSNKLEKQEKDTDPLASFFDEVAEIESANQQKKTNVDHSVETEGWNTINQLERILQKHHRFLNLNPYHVFGLGHEANEEDIKRRYHRLSALVHPDKNSDPRAREAFEFVTKAHAELRDESRRDFFHKTFTQCRQSVQQHRNTLLKNLRGDESRLIEMEGSLEDAVEKEIRKVLAVAEQNRIKAEKVRAANEELIARTQMAKEPNWAEVKREQDLIKEGTDERVKNWMAFQTKKKMKM